VAAKPTRRVVLAAAALLPLAAASGCGSVDVLATPPSEGPAVRLLRSAIAAEQTMIAQYGTVLHRAHGGGADLTAELEPLLAEHRAHLAQLQSRLVIPAGSSASAPPSPSPSPSGRAATAPAVPTAPAAAIAFLKNAEQAAATALLARLVTAPASLAQLFASISASEATHVPVLAVVASRAGRAG
jgi:rubrerythrin